MDIARLSPAAQHMLSDLKKLSGSSETALLEQAIMHYYRELLGKDALRQKLHTFASSKTPPHPSPEQQEVLSWLGEVFSSDPIPLEAPTDSSEHLKQLSFGRASDLPAGLSSRVLSNGTQNGTPDGGSGGGMFSPPMRSIPKTRMKSVGISDSASDQISDIPTPQKSIPKPTTKPVKSDIQTARGLYESKPNLKIRRSDLGMSQAELAQQSGLEEALLQTLEEGNLILLNLQEQWALASALDWSLETLQEAVAIKSF
jgi:DNA-binding XRE family transcriptional regulator